MKLIKGVTIGVFVIFVASGVALLGVSIFRKLESDEIGLRYNSFTKNLSEKVENEGLYSGPPGFYFIRFPSVYKSMFFDDFECLNSEGIKILLDVTFQYKIRSNHLHQIVQEFRNETGYKTVLLYSAYAAIHESCSEYRTEQFQSQRALFQEHVRQKMRERFEIFHTNISDLQVNNISWPSEYEEKVRSKEKAREDIQVAINERPKILTEARTDVKKAKIEADIIVDKAISDAKILQNQAREDAETIFTQYKMESKAYEQVLSETGLNITLKGLIAYLGVRVISDSKNPVHIGLPSPAATTYKNEL